MKKIKQTCYFNPSVAFYFEELATTNKTTFNNEVNRFIEKKLKEEEKETKIISKLESIEDVQNGILEILENLAIK